MATNIYIQNREIQNNNYIVLSLLFLVSPLFGLIFTLYYVMHPPYNERKIWLLLFMGIFWVSLVNMCKVPENDLVNYIDAYQQAGTVSFYEWYKLASSLHFPVKDYGYVTYVGVLSQVFGTNGYAYKFVTSFVIYLLMGVSMVKVALRFKLSISLVATLVCILLFTPFTFTMSLQIIRQFMAGAILFFLLVRRTCYVKWKEFIKHNWFFVILMFLFHKSSLLFVVLLGLPFLGESLKCNKLKYLLLFGILVAYQSVSGAILSNLGFLEDSALGDTLERASTDTTFELTAPSPAHILIILLFIYSAVMVAYKSKYSLHAGIKHTYNIIIILAVFVLMNLRQGELSARLYNYLICFLPFVTLPFLVKVRPSSLYAMCIVVVVCWILYLKYGVWTYDIPGNVIITPVLGYFI